MIDRLYSKTVLDLYRTYHEVPPVITSKDARVRWRPFFSFWILLALIGIASATVAFCIDALMFFWIFPGRDRLIEWTHGAPLYIGLSIIASLLVAFICTRISPAARGSGIPEVKVLLAGGHVPDFLSMYTLVSKIVGLTLGMTANLYIGKEGPLVHISACIASLLSKITHFQKGVIGSNNRNAILASAVAIGVTATFGAPIGGVIFAIEVTATYFVVMALWRMYFGCAVCMITFVLFRHLIPVHLFGTTDLPPWPFSPEIILFIILGGLLGLVGAVFIFTSSSIMNVGSRLRMSTAWSYILTGVAGLIFSCLGFYVPVMLNTDRNRIDELFTDTPLDSEIWGEGLRLLFLFPLARLIGLGICVGLPITCGVFAPTFVAGAALGRFFGVLVGSLFDGVSHPASYAVVGAASLAGGVTRTVSVAVIVFELTGQLNLMLPVLSAVLTAFAVQNALTCSIYDLMRVKKKINYLPEIKESREYLKTAGEIAYPPQSVSLYIDQTTLSEAYITCAMTNIDDLPVVKSRATPLLIGSISRRRLMTDFKRRQRRAASTQGESPTMSAWRPVLPRGGNECMNGFNSFMDDLKETNLRVYDSVLFNPHEYELDTCPLLVPPDFPVLRLQYIFVLLGLKFVFVCDSQKHLRGVVTTESFHQSGIGLHIADTRENVRHLLHPDRPSPTTLNPTSAINLENESPEED